jgi:hypothetical protein
MLAVKIPIIEIVFVFLFSRHIRLSHDDIYLATIGNFNGKSYPCCLADRIRRVRIQVGNLFVNRVWVREFCIRQTKWNSYFRCDYQNQRENVFIESSKSAVQVRIWVRVQKRLMNRIRTERTSLTNGLTSGILLSIVQFNGAG